jgi:hypothetical protein
MTGIFQPHFYGQYPGGQDHYLHPHLWPPRDGRQSEKFLFFLALLTFIATSESLVITRLINSI